MTIERLIQAGRVSNAPASGTESRLTGPISAALLSLLQAPAQPIECADKELHGLMVEVARLHIELAAVSARLLEELIARKSVAARLASILFT